MAIVVTWFQTPLPRFRLFQILPGNTNLVGILIHKFGIPIETLGWALPTFCGFLVGVLIFALAGLVKKLAKTGALVATAASLFLLLSLALTLRPCWGTAILT